MQMYIEGMKVRFYQQFAADGKIVKICLKIKMLRFSVLAPFDPLYLRNGKSYVKSVLHTTERYFNKESKEKNRIKI